MDLGKNQAAPAALTERTRNSRRCMRPPEDWRLGQRLHHGGQVGEGLKKNDWSKPDDSQLFVVCCRPYGRDPCGFDRGQPLRLRFCFACDEANPSFVMTTDEFKS